MLRNPADLADREFDIAIIGGGITGACLAADAALRGMSVALVEKADFGAATSAASSKLLHGGMRYLQQGAPGKLRESALERVYFQVLAPHLTRYVPFLVPTSRSLSKSLFVMHSALRVYELLCSGQNRHVSDPDRRVPDGRVVGAAEVAGMVPDLDMSDVTGGILFYESHMHNSERMTLAFVDTAVREGAAVLNYAVATGFVRSNGRVSGVTVRDGLGGESFDVRARVVVNAAGPWIPLLNQTLGTQDVGRIVTGYSKGAHIVVPALTRDVAVALTTRKKTQALLTRGGRHVFIIPWRGHALIGTTYSGYQGELDDVRPEEQDIEELIGDINSALGTPVLQRSDVAWSYAGIYPLIEDRINPRVYQGTGEYQVLDHGRKNGIEGLFSVFGAKFTTARLLAEKALDTITRRCGMQFAACTTRTRPLAAGNVGNVDSYATELVSQFERHVPAEVIRHLVTCYGSAARQVLDLVDSSPGLGRQLAPGHPVIAAECVYAARHEMACHLPDVIFRRTGLGTLGNPGHEVLAQCAALLAAELGWNDARIRCELDDTLAGFRF